MHLQVRIPVSDFSGTGEVRRTVDRMAVSAGLAAHDVGRAALVATEMANNLARHTPGGEVLIRILDETPDSGIELLAIDRGPGMADINRCLQDGYSTAGTPGNGMGAIQRKSSVFSIYSAQPGGTVVLSRIFAKEEPPRQQERIVVGAINVPYPGEVACGDMWSLVQQPAALALIMVDGLGHGVLAAEAAQQVVSLFRLTPFEPPAEFLQRIHSTLRSTRGGAVAIAHWELASGAIRYAGIGNISGTLISATNRTGLMSHNGAVGVQMQRVQEFRYNRAPGSLLIMHSDGVQTRWTLQQYAGLVMQHPSVIAGVIYRDFLRGKDDATIVVVSLETRFR